MSSDGEDGMEGEKEIISVARIELKHLLALPTTWEVWGNSNICPTDIIIVSYEIGRLLDLTVVEASLGIIKTILTVLQPLPCLSKIS